MVGYICLMRRLDLAKKLDKGKPRMDLINPRFLEELGEGLGFGASKYSDYNYREGEGLDRSRLYASAMRHLLKYAKGEKIDEERAQVLTQIIKNDNFGQIFITDTNEHRLTAFCEAIGKPYTTLLLA